MAESTAGPSNTRQQAAWERGQQARKKGQPLTVNPHKRDKVSKEWWITGWNLADRELQS